MMVMKPEELRQLRAWAFDKALDKAALTASSGSEIDIAKVIADARKILNYVRANP